MNTAMSIKIVINTLNNVEVRGKENMDRLLGCIQTLERIVITMQNSEKNAETETEAANG